MFKSRCYTTNCMYDFQVNTFHILLLFNIAWDCVYVYNVIMCTITLKATENTLHPVDAIHHDIKSEYTILPWHFIVLKGKMMPKESMVLNDGPFNHLFRLRSILFVLNISNLKNRKCSNFRLVAPNEFIKMEIPAQWWHPLIISIVMYVDEYVRARIE